MSMMTMMLAVGGAAGIDFNAEFLVIGGGGQTTVIDYGLAAGGGAGGYISSVSGECSGGGASALPAVGLTTGSATYSVTVGAAGSDSIFSGTDNAAASFNHTAIAGGGSTGGDNSDDGDSGGSGGGGNVGRPRGSGGAGTTGQGYAGADSGLFETTACNDAPSNWVQDQCRDKACGGGGGAGAVGSGKNGGIGVQSSITGTATYYAGGGYANQTTGNFTSGSNGSAGNGQSNYGGGGNVGSAGQDGVVILRYPNTVTISNSGGGLTMSTATVGANKVTTITAGTGSIEFTPA